MSPFFPAAILMIRIVDTIGVILVVDGAKQNIDTNPLLPRLRQSKVVLDRALVLLIFAFPAIPADRCHGARLGLSPTRFSRKARRLHSPALCARARGNPFDRRRRVSERSLLSATNQLVVCSSTSPLPLLAPARRGKTENDNRGPALALLCCLLSTFVFYASQLLNLFCAPGT